MSVAVMGSGGSCMCMDEGWGAGLESCLQRQLVTQPRESCSTRDVLPAVRARTARSAAGGPLLVLCARQVRCSCACACVVLGLRVSLSAVHM